jgi:hypothetical protein
MINNYQDAIAICRAYRNPDLFITFTCNANWLEIQRELRKERFYRQEDKTNIVTWIFCAKLADMWLSNQENHLVVQLQVFPYAFFLCVLKTFHTFYFITWLSKTIQPGWFNCLRCSFTFYDAWSMWSRKSEQ